MPNIPTPQNRVSARAGGIEGYAGADTFGANIGAATQRLGGVLGQAAGALGQYAEEEQDRKRRENISSQNARAAVDLNRISLEVRQNAPANGVGTSAETRRLGEEYIAKTTAGIADPVERQALKNSLTERLAQYEISGQQFEFQQDAENSKLEAGAALNGLENLVRSDASQYDNVVKDGLDVINARPGFSQFQKDVMAQEWRQKAALGRFDGALASAKTVADFDAIETELTTAGEGRWLKELPPQAFEGIRRDIKTAKSAFASQADAQARVALDGAEARIKSGVPIGSDELTELQGLASASANPVTARRIARAARDNQILTKDARLPPAQLRQRQQAALGGTSFPRLPVRLSDAVNETSQKFPGVSAGYLGNTAIREYGQHLKVGRRGDAKYAPTAVHDGVDLKGIAPEVADAVTVAGQIFGRPLPVTSGFRSQAKQNALGHANPAGVAAGRIAKDSNHTHGTALDISTAGMSGEEKAKMVDALVQSGFTGFGEYGTHIHADMRNAAPKNFNAQNGQLGWTKGSPEVVAALARRGFAGGRSAAEIDRSGANIPGVDEVDYGQGTSMTNDDGRPTTSVQGVFQFTSGTWLTQMKDGSTPQRIGLNIEGMSDQALLDMRKDPRISTLMAGALAEKNKAQVEAAIGRPIDDAELYMAHFLGAGGATALLNAYKTNGDMSAAELLPQAANSNRPVFYANGKPLTVRQLYDSVATKFSTSPGAVEFGDAETYRGMADRATKQLGDDPMQYAMQSGVVAPVDLSAPGGYAALGAAAGAAADYYNIPSVDMKPFTNDQAAGITKTLKEGNANDVLQIMSQLQAMDEAKPGMAKAAYAQLGEKDTVLSHAAGLAYEQGNAQVAAQIVRGQKLLASDEGLKAAFGSANEARQTFNATTGGALMRLPAGSQNAVFEAAKAHYAETYVSQGNYEFDATAFEKSTAAVLGDSKIHEFNGEPMVLPPGVTPELFDTAMQRITDAELISLSEDKLPPRDADGQPVSAEDVQLEGRFEALGGNEYRIRMDDGAYLITGEPDTVGNAKVFVFVAEAEALDAIANKPIARGAPTVSSTVEPSPAAPNGDPTADPSTAPTLPGVTP